MSCQYGDVFIIGQRPNYAQSIGFLCSSSYGYRRLIFIFEMKFEYDRGMKWRVVLFFHSSVRIIFQDKTLLPRHDNYCYFILDIELNGREILHKHNFFT